MKSLGKDKLLKIGIGIVAAVVLIIVLLLVFHAIVGGKKNGYSDIENEVLKAAKKYYGENENLLPQNENEQITIDDVSLTSLGYLKSLNEYTKDKEGVVCSCKVVISYNNASYRYTPLLDCGDSYKSQTLSDYLTNNVERVYTGAGLYDLNGELVYRGETPNNYVKFSGNLYRIVKITDNHVVLILDSKSERTVWDDRFNTNRNANDGINDYSVSRIKDSLTSLYNSNDLISDGDKSLLYKHPVYIGKRAQSDNFNDGSIEKSEYFDNQYIGLLPLYDYINASIDNNCKSALDVSCTNYNYLNYVDYNWWTTTADSQSSHRVYRIAYYGTIEQVMASSSGYIRPVIYLVDDALYVDGDGSKDNPYIVK